MSIYTFVVDFGEGANPLISKHTNILGGKLNAVQFSDALAELELVKDQRDDLLEALDSLVSACEPTVDHYELDQALLVASEAIDKAMGESE